MVLLGALMNGLEAFVGGVLGLALSSPDKQTHLLIRDREVQTLHFNGYFTSVQIH